MPQTYMIVPQSGDSPGYLSHYDDNGQPVGAPISGYLGGFESWNISNGAVYDTNNPFDPIRFDPSRQNFVEISDNGSFRIQIGTSINNVNSAVSSNIERGVAGTIDISLSDGNSLTVPLDFAGAQPVGKRWAVYTDVFGDTQLAAVPGNMTLAQLNSDNPIYDRWATTVEVITQAITGRLVRAITSRDEETKDVFSRVLDAMGITKEEFKNNGSGSVAGWVEMNRFDLEGATRYSFGPSGEKVR